MASLNMQGPFPFTREEVERQITIPSAGVFALGYLQGIDFVVLYIGRADEDLKAALESFIGKHQKYKVFKYCYTVSAHAAYERQCKNFHDFGGIKKQLHNTEHPDAGPGLDWPCPFCATEAD